MKISLKKNDEGIGVFPLTGVIVYIMVIMYYGNIKGIIHLLVICIVLLVPFDGNTLETELSIQLEESWILVSARLIGIDSGEIVTSLEEGLTAEIFYQFRLYRKNTGFFSLLGDWLLIEKKPAYIAYKDSFLDEYIIKTSEGNTLTFHDADDFINQFCRLEGYHFAGMEDIDLTECYMLARISVNPVKLEPPLHLIVIISSIGRTTAWAEWHLLKEEGEK